MKFVARFILNAGISTDVPEIIKQDDKPDKNFRKALKASMRSNFAVTKVIPQATVSSSIWKAKPHEDLSKAVDAFIVAAKAHAAKN